jgi:hypothetical protein
MLRSEKSGYERLIELLNQEWTCLKRRDITGLISLTRIKEDRILEMKEIRGKIREWLEAAGWDGQTPKAEPGPGGNGAPDRDALLANELQRTIGRLKKEIFSLNERNKRYIEETLKIVEHFFSLLALPEETPAAYMRYENGRSAQGARALISRRL